MGQALWVFDLDNTLVPTNLNYLHGAYRFGFLMGDALFHRAPHYRLIPSLLYWTDQARLGGPHSLSRDRFAESMVETYRKLCRRVGILPDPEVERKCWGIVFSVLDEENYRKTPMIPGAEEVLNFLLARGNLVFCVTTGEEELQWAKWRGYNLGRFFPTERQFLVTGWDKGLALRTLRVSYPDRPAFMVGDSIGRDLIPAAEAGMTPVYVPPGAAWEKQEKKLKPPPVTIRLKKIIEIKERFVELFPTD